MRCVTTLGPAEMSSSVCFQEMEVRHHTPGAGLVRLTLWQERLRRRELLGWAHLASGSVFTSTLFV